MHYYFISWIDIEGELYYLTDKEIFSYDGLTHFAGIPEPEFVLGHEAIREFYSLRKGSGTEHNCREFWNPVLLPTEINEKIVNFEKHFGRTFKEKFWTYNYNEFMLHQRAPEEWRERAWNTLLEQEKDDCLFWSTIAVKYSWGVIPNKWKEIAWQELIKRGVKIETLQYLKVNAPQPWNERAGILLEKMLEKNK